MTTTQLTFLALAAVLGVTNADAAPAPRSVLDFQARTIQGKAAPLKQYKGKVLLIVNTASHCGFTPQYEALEDVYQRYHARGFEVLAFPANDFAGQEPGTDSEIQTFCTTKYKTTFPLFSKISVKGDAMHPLYHYLTESSPFPGAIGWNFTKFLVGPDGQVIARFDSRTKPDDPAVIAAIEKVLPAKS